MQDHTIGINERNAKYVYKHNPRKYFPLANDKVQTKEILHQHGIPAPQTYGILEGMGAIDAEWNRVNKHHKLAIKPAKGSGGGGILVLAEYSNEKWQKPSGSLITTLEIHTHLANIVMGLYSSGNYDRAIIEYCIESHEWLKSIYEIGVPDLRIIVFNQVPVMAMLRVPTSVSGGKANLHQNAIGISVALKTGRLGEGLCGNIQIDKHPDSGCRFQGQFVPFWKEILDISVESSKVFPLNYLGVDLVLDQNKGPLVMEVNARPGLQIQNVNKQGLSSLLRNAS